MILNRIIAITGQNRMGCGERMGVVHGCEFPDFEGHILGVSQSALVFREY